MKLLSRHIARFFLFYLIFISFMSCASIVNGSTQKVFFETDPSAVEITITKKSSQSIVFSGRTPVEIKLKRSAAFFEPAEYIVTMEKTGYEKKEINLEADINGGWYIAGNFFIGGLLGWVVIDPATGAMWCFDEEYYYRLEQELAIESPSDQTLVISMSESLSSELLSHAVKIH